MNKSIKLQTAVIIALTASVITAGIVLLVFTMPFPTASSQSEQAIGNSSPESASEPEYIMTPLARGYYEGYWENDEPNGKGTFIFPGGYVYYGDFVAGNKHGKGKMYILEGVNWDWYDGDWKEGRKTGEGTQSGMDENGLVWTYAGEFVNDDWNGIGELTWSNGNIYIGEFLEGMMHGHGKLVYTDGKVEEGLWSCNEFINE